MLSGGVLCHNLEESTSKFLSDTLATGVGAQFFAQWTVITTCHVFAASSFALCKSYFKKATSRATHFFRKWNTKIWQNPFCCEKKKRSLIQLFQWTLLLLYPFWHFLLKLFTLLFVKTGFSQETNRRHICSLFFTCAVWTWFSPWLVLTSCFLPFRPTYFYKILRDEKRNTYM